MAPSATETTTLPSHTAQPVKLTSNVGPYKELAPIGYEKKAEEEANNPDSDLIIDRPRKFKKINLPNGYSLSKKDKQRILMFQEIPFISPY